MIIVLMGYMGVGKTSVGQKLTDKMDSNFVDLDTVIEQGENQSISDIFNTKGELFFRKKESEYLKRIIDCQDNIILSLGGGTPCYSNNLSLLKSSNNLKSFYLKLPIPDLVDRLFSEKEYRPIIAHIKSKEELMEFVGKHLFERNPYYNQSDYTISCKGKSVDDIANDILKRLI